MKAHVAPQDWIDYLDGIIDPARSGRIESHLGRCPDCRDAYMRLSDQEELLRSRAAEFRAQSTDKGLSSAQCDMHGVPLHLCETVTSVLAAICGTETSERVWRAARRRASADLAAGLVAEPSTLLRHLRSITGSLCGEHAARLIWEFGMQLQRREV